MMSRTSFAASVILIASGGVFALSSNALGSDAASHEPASSPSTGTAVHDVWVVADPPLSPSEATPPFNTPDNIGATETRSFGKGRWQYETTYKYTNKGWTLLRYSAHAKHRSKLPLVRKPVTLSPNCGDRPPINPQAETGDSDTLRPSSCGGGHTRGAPGPDDIPKPTTPPGVVLHDGDTRSAGWSNWNGSGYSVDITWVWHADSTGHGTWNVKHFETNLETDEE
jgi:hypothetical protein